MPTPKKRNNESMLNAAERLIADVAANPYAIYGTSGEGIENLKYLLDGMFRERYGTRATPRVEEAIRDHGAPSYHEEVGMTTRPITVSDDGGLDYRGRRTVKPINQGSVKRINPDLGIIEKYPYMRQERQRLEDAKADEMNAILADLVRNPPRKTVGEGYQNGGTVKYRPGGMIPKYPGGGMMPRKYEQGGPVGSSSSDQKFRVIPEKSPTGQTELAYYIDGRPVESQDFQQQFYDAGNKPQDLNQLIENSVIASKQGIGADSGIPSGSPLEGLMKQYRDALKERNVYREKGAAGVDSLYNARNENYDRMIRQMGG